MTLFLLAIALVFVATGTCALIEAALYAVRRPYIWQLKESGHRSGIYLEKFQEKMDYPITAILVFDTMLGVGGAAIAGSQARALYGETFVYWFTLAMALALLVFAQIIPKILGVIYNESVARWSAPPIAMAIKLLFPFVKAIEILTRGLKPDRPQQHASEEDVRQMSRISASEGSILDVEADLIQNSLKLNDVRAQQIMTPVSSAVTFDNSITVREAFRQFKKSSHSRLPLHQPGQPTIWTGVVFSRDILYAMAHDRFDQRLNEISKPLHFVAAASQGHVLLDQFLKKRTHLFAVQSSSEPDKVIGLVTLEDVFEEILGKEIIDERDSDRTRH